MRKVVPILNVNLRGKQKVRKPKPNVEMSLVFLFPAPLSFLKYCPKSEYACCMSMVAAVMFCFEQVEVQCICEGECFEQVEMPYSQIMR